MNNSSMVSKDRLDFDPVIPEDERRFYQKAYPNINYVCERKVHCTVCKMHIGTAPSNESIIRMHPILRVTHCKKCHEFYNSGEFSKGEDGSELYCRWCGQGGEVYCCSNCPFVFCKSCIISNLSRGVVADIEQNENWSCFNCAPKMLWPLRAQHWALIKFIDKQKKAILNSNLSDAEIKAQMIKDRSLCCKTKKTSGYGSDSSGTSDISLSRLKQKAGEKRNRKSLSKEDLSTIGSPAMPKKPKANDEVVCTPDVMSMLETECQLAAPPAPKPTVQPTASSPKIMSIPRPSPPPPIMVRNAQVTQMRPQGPTAVVKKTVIGPRMPGTTGNGDFSTPVYHTINGYRIDLNSAAQQETVRLPNGKLIQVKRQGTGPQTVTTVQSAPSPQVTQARVIQNAIPPTTIQTIGNVPTQQIVHSSGGHIIRAQLQTPRSITVQNPSIIPQFQQQATPQYQQITIRQPNQQIATIRYQGTPSQQVTNILQNGTVQLLNGTAVTTTGGQVATVRQVPTFVKQFFPNTPLGVSRTQLQNQIFSAMEICQHLMGKVQTLTNSNAYKTAKSLTDVKELYIHLSYLLTYAIGRFKGLQDNCLSDMRDLGFTNDANSLENGQLAAEKQASDAEEDEITIVEPKTDTINLDSDNEEEHIASNKSNTISQPTPIVRNHTNNTPTTTYPNADSPNITNTNTMNMSHQMPLVNPTTTTNAQDELTAEYDFSKLNFLANMLDVDLTEGNGVAQVPKKPRKKTTNKPNPTLLKQKEIQERERLENIKKNDAKLKMQVQIPLNKVEDIYEYAKPLLDDLKYDNDELEGKDEGIRVMDLLEGDIKIHQKEVKVTADNKAEDENDKKLVKEVDKLNDTEEETCGKNNKKDEKEISMESDEVILVEVEHLNQSNKSVEQNNDSEENEILLAEIIEHDECQDSYQGTEPMESSSISNDMTLEREETKEDSCELPNEDEGEKQSVDTEIEETEFLNHDNNENKDELEEETEVIIDFESNTCEAIKTAKIQDSDEEESLEMDINADPLENKIEKNLSVPAENRNIVKNVDNSLDAAMLRTMLVSKE